MIYLLRTLLSIMLISLILTALVGFHPGYLINIGHIKIAIASFLFTILIQAFVMFYFIGVNRLSKNILIILHDKENLDELFDVIPDDLSEYQQKSELFYKDTTRCKRQTIPWTMLILALGTLGFLLGGAYDTHIVQKSTHAGVIYGFFMACLIGVVRQWYFLGIANKTLRKIKHLFSLSDLQM